jgi:Flp pilus assembly protein TadG
MTRLGKASDFNFVDDSYAMQPSIGSMNTNRYQPFWQRKIRPRRGRTARGVAAAELAVCLPIVVLMVIATIEACSAVFLKQSLTVAAYEGVRTALEEEATAKDVRATCDRILADRRVKKASVRVRPSNIDALQPGDYVDITVSAPAAANSVVPANFYRGRTLSATASMMIEN